MLLQLHMAESSVGIVHCNWWIAVLGQGKKQTIHITTLMPLYWSFNSCTVFHRFTAWNGRRCLWTTSQDSSLLCNNYNNIDPLTFVHLFTYLPLATTSSRAKQSLVRFKNSKYCHLLFRQLGYTQHVLSVLFCLTMDVCSHICLCIHQWRTQPILKHWAEDNRRYTVTVEKTATGEKVYNISSTPIYSQNNCHTLYKLHMTSSGYFTRNKIPQCHYFKSVVQTYVLFKMDRKSCRQ